LVIIDTGSDDNTVEIAKEFTDRIYFHEWNNHFAEMRNKVIDYCRGEWLFVIDGDEVVKDPTGLINFFKNDLDEEYNTGVVEQRSFTDIKESHFGALLVPRLFRLDDDFHYEGAIHNQPIFKGPVIDLNLTLLHYGYDSNDLELMERKFERTGGILKQELEKDPENIYYWYQLSKSYGMHQDHEEALECVEKAYNLLQDKDINLEGHLYIYSQYAKKLLYFKRYQEVNQICDEALSIKEGYLDFYYFKAVSLARLGKNERAIYNCNVYLSLRDNYFDTPSRTDMAFVDTTLALESVIYIELAKLHYDEGNYHEAIKHGLLVEEDRLASALPWIIKSYLQLDKYQELREYYTDYLKAKPEELQESFWQELENAKLNLDQVNSKALEDLFSDVRDEYGLLNRVRLKLDSDQLASDDKKDLITEIEDLDLNELDYYYGDLLYYLFKLDYSIMELLSTTRESIITQFLVYLSEVRDDVYNLILTFLEQENTINDIKQARIIKVLGRFLLIKDEIKLKNYIKTFDLYLTAGIYYIREIYSDYIITNQLDYEIDSSEDEFLLEMKIARENKGSDDLLYVRSLKSALNKFPAMKKGIQLLLSDFQDELKSEFDTSETKDELKEKIKDAINQTDLDKAERLIDKYSNKFNLDADFYSMKATVFVYKGQLEKAKNILVAGLIDNSYNFDLLYNLGVIYKELTQDQEAYNVFSEAKRMANSQDERKDVTKRLNELQINNINQRKRGSYPVSSDVQSLSCTPFFIIGCGRSGTTLLRSILNAHSDISIPPELISLANMITKYKKFNFISWNDLIKIIISTFKSTLHFSIWEVELDEIFEQLLELEVEERTLAKIIDTIYSNFLKHNFPKAKIWGDKTPLNTLNIELIDEVFPGAKYIHLVRNGKDVVSSYLNSTKYVNSVEGACARWNNHVSKALEFKNSQDEDEYLEIYYEDLVTAPKQEIEKICQFIGIEFDSTMLNYHDQLSKLKDTKAKQHKNLHRSINTDSIG
ncbi:MAG: sulfotransferase, partial [Bacillota bacterium]